MLSVSLLISVGCATQEIPDFKAHITLPASGNGYWVKSVSPEEGMIPKAEWEQVKRRGIIILPEDWKILRNTVLKNCLVMECKNAVGIFDDIFFSLDEALKKTPILN